MRNPVTTIIILMFLSFFGQLNAAGKHEKNDTLNCLLIKGKVSNASEGPDKNCLVELITSDGVAESILLEGKRNFRFLLRRDTYYAIRISKPGYVTKLISVNTSFPQDVMDVMEFSFTTELIREEFSQHLNKDALDFPIAIIHFDFNSEDFVYNKAYTQQIKREIYTVDSHKTFRVLASANEMP